MEIKVPEMMLGVGPQDSLLVVTQCHVVLPGRTGIWEGLGEAGGTLLLHASFRCPHLSHAAFSMAKYLIFLMGMVVSTVGRVSAGGEQNGTGSGHDEGGDLRTGPGRNLHPLFHLFNLL